jgi:hypothetical protein
MVTKYYRDAGGNYIGSFSGDTGAVPDGAIEVLNPPLNGLAKWNGSNWNEPQQSRDELIQTDIAEQGFTDQLAIQAIIRKFMFNDTTLWDQLQGMILTSEAKYPEKI